jgi:hypothetical protein
MKWTARAGAGQAAALSQFDQNPGGERVNPIGRDGLLASVASAQPAL